MNIQAIFFDIDGTLVSFNTHRVSDSTIQALNELRRKGIKVFIATGRAAASINNLGDLKFDGYITMNGSCCYVENEIIHKQTILKSNIKALIEYVENVDSFPCFFTDGNEPFCNYSNEISDKVFESLNFPPPEPKPIGKALEAEICQMSVFYNKQDEEKILALLPDCKTASWSPHFSDIIPKESGKENGIDRMLAHFNIPLEATMAFGDGGNDISMLQHVKTGVAMGDANDEVKQAADYVTSSVDEDGIRKALEHFGILA
jgi:Cof subfamily protein (haloacid dehalogenase superfamily)